MQGCVISGAALLFLPLSATNGYNLTFFSVVKGVKEWGRCRDGTPVPSASGLHLTLPFVEADGIGTTKCSRPNGSPKGKRNACSNAVPTIR